MVSNKQRILLTQTIIVCVLLCLSVTASASNWLLAPYGVASGGLRVRAGWPFNGKEQWSFENVPLFVGAGALYNPSELDDWALSGEFLYHQTVGWTGERGLFVLGKVAFPHSEGIETYGKVGLGGLWLTHEPKKDEPTSTVAGIVCIGRNWHIRNGYYFNGQISYIYPFAENSKQSFSLTIGLQWNLI